MPGQKALLEAIQTGTRVLPGGSQLFVVHPDEARRALGPRTRRKVDPNAVVAAGGRRLALELLAKRWPARVYAALRGAEDDLEQALLGSLAAPDWDLESILRMLPHLSADVREIATGARGSDALLEGCLEAGRALRRVGLPAAHVATELASRLVQLAREAQL